MPWSFCGSRSAAVISPYLTPSAAQRRLVAAERQRHAMEIALGSAGDTDGEQGKVKRGKEISVTSSVPHGTGVRSSTFDRCAYRNLSTAFPKQRGLFRSEIFS
jgi:uncharacterized protein involved in propanediol utilization